MTAKNKRKTISKKTRFEVFKRDGFCCQYCGKSAPDVVLEVDHIDPVSRGGADELLNYLTACRDCNAGKSDRTLNDNSILQKQRAQLQELSIRREQLSMMLEWRNGLKSIQDDQVEAVRNYWAEQVPGWAVNESGVKQIASLLRKHDLMAFMNAIDIAVERYIKTSDDGELEPNSVNLAWAKVGGILSMANASDEVRQLHYIKGILRNRLNYTPVDVVNFLSAAADDGIELETLKELARNARSWTGFRNDVAEELR